MYLYNITFAAEEAVEDELLQWLKYCFLPECADCQMTDPGVFRIMGRSEPGTVSIAVHMYAPSVEDIENWYADCGSRLFSDALDRWGQRVVFFPTMMECI